MLTFTDHKQTRPDESDGQKSKKLRPGRTITIHVTIATNNHVKITKV